MSDCYAGMSKGSRRRNAVCSELPVPRGLQYNPFAEPYLLTPEEKARRRKAAQEESDRLQLAAAAIAVSNADAGACDDLNDAVNESHDRGNDTDEDDSDWSDCDLEEFNAMLVRTCTWRFYTLGARNALATLYC